MLKKRGKMNKGSKPIIRGLKNKFSKKFKVTTESQNRFCFEEAFYNPDLVFWSKKDNSIKAIIEVEQGTRKHMVGGVITADYCMGKMKQSPTMFVLALERQDRKDYLKRQKMFQAYTCHLKRIFIGNKKEVSSALSRL
jgi:hypothetical protein